MTKSKSYAAIRRQRRQEHASKQVMESSSDKFEVAKKNFGDFLTSYPSPSASSSWSMKTPNWTWDDDEPSWSPNSNLIDNEPPRRLQLSPLKITPRWTLPQRKRDLAALSTPSAWRDPVEKLSYKRAQCVELGDDCHFLVNKEELEKIAAENPNKPIDLVDKVASKFGTKCEKRGFDYPDEDYCLMMALTREVIVHYGTGSTMSVLELIRSSLTDGLRKRRYAASRREKRRQQQDQKRTKSKRQASKLIEQ